MKLGDTIFNGNQFKNVILNSVSFKRLILGVNLVWSYFSIAIKSFKTRILADGGTYEAESILEDKLQEITPNLFDSASLVITPNGVKTSKLYTIKPNDGTGDLTVTRNTSATRINENGNIVDVSANVARIDYATGVPAILVEPQRTNLVYPSDIATTQVRAVTAQVYTLSFYGTGTVTLSGAFSGSLIGTGTNNRVSLTFTPTAGNLTLTVSGSVTNWQLEAGNTNTSLIKTISGSVTRNADVISKSGVSSMIGQTEGTLFLDASSFNFLGSGVGERISFTDGTFNNRVSIDLQPTTAVSLVASNSTLGLTGVINSPNGLISPNNKFKIAIAYNGINSVLYVNGVAFTNIVGTVPTFNGQLNKVEFNQGNASRPFFGRVNNLIVYPNRLTNLELQQLTTL